MSAGAAFRGKKRNSDKRMSLGQHLIELRRRIIICAIAICIAMITAFFFTDMILVLLQIPIEQVRQKGDIELAALNFTVVTEAFNLRLQISLAVGFLLSAPVWLWQIWAFIMPAMTKKEIRYTVSFVLAAIPLFFAGCALGIWIAPQIITVMANFLPSGTGFYLTAMTYYDFILKLLLGVGIVCVLPVFLVGLNLAGIISGKTILQGWRVALLIAMLFSALITPAADIASMVILTTIFMLLYFAMTGISLLFDRRQKKALEKILTQEQVSS